MKYVPWESKFSSYLTSFHVSVEGEKIQLLNYKLFVYMLAFYPLDLYCSIWKLSDTCCHGTLEMWLIQIEMCCKCKTHTRFEDSTKRVRVFVNNLYNYHVEIFWLYQVIDDIKINFTCFSLSLCLLGNVKWHVWLTLHSGEHSSNKTKADARGKRLEAGRPIRNSSWWVQERHPGLNHLSDTHLQNPIQDLLLRPKLFQL